MTLPSPLPLLATHFPPWSLGLTAFAVLLLLLFVVTRFNQDR